ncbi:MAG TPA: hypothetical protein P5150_08455, partial [Candidatus Ratteibacteria bacterium]|nr:hypothetical protein [Candidatus Ratteibacteria bacterium]
MRKTLYLKEGWKLNYTSFGNEITEDSNGWIDAKVPGDVHIDLFKAGEKTEFFYGLNADLWRWVEDKDFWYRNKFIIPEISKDEVCYLIFEGIDTFAEIYINGRTVKTSENMFLPVEVDITNFCKKSREIKLAVKISSPIYSLNMKDKKVNDWNPARIFVRKSQFNYGWDIAPRLISCGIWRPVKIEIYNSGRINDVYIKTERIEKDLVILKGNVELEFFKNFKNNRVKVELFEDSCEERKEKIYEISKKVENKNLNFKVELKNPKLWWPNDIGEQNLYSYCVNFYRGDEIVDKKEGDFGIKKIELIQKKMNNRKTFYFRINGVDIFIKGFNWTPCDVFPARVSEEKYEKLLNLVKETGANMLRVWGGGIYETELFYKICDKYGIMV